MSIGKYIGRVGALAVALGVGVATALPTASAATPPPPDRTALIVCGTSCPTPDPYWVDSVRTHFIAPTHPGENIAYVPVTTPQELWPATGVLRLIGITFGPPEVWHLGGGAWPDEPLWKLSGLFDLSADQSVEVGAADLEAAIVASHGPLVINGYSQGAAVANVVKSRLAEQYPTGTAAPDIDFVLGGDPNLPNGGLASRFAGLYIPILDFSFTGPAQTDTQFDTVEINQQYDGFADFPLYPLNVVADLNAVMGMVYLHTDPFGVSLPDDPTTSPAYQGTHGDTSYYFFQTDNLPLFEPLRRLGVPESLIDVVEPAVKVIVETGYDRSIPPWEPTPARLIPRLKPAAVAADLVEAIGKGAANAGALVDNSAPAAEGLSLDATQGDAERRLPTVTHRINRSADAVESIIGNGRTIVRTPLDSPGSTAGAERKTPVADAIKHVNDGVKKFVSRVSDGIQKAIHANRGDDAAS